MGRRSTLLLLLLTLVLLPATEASAHGLSLPKAKALVAKKAETVKRHLRSEGATEAKVPACWRVHAHKAACYFLVLGYDRALGVHWHCMLRVTVRLSERHGGRYRLGYGRPVCG